MRYSLYDVDSSNARGAGALNAPSASSGLDNQDQTVAFSNTLTLSPRTVNETRAQFAYGDLLALPTDPIGPAVSIAGVASFGTLSSSPTGRLNKMYQVVNNLSHQAGAHALRVGVDFLYNDDRDYVSAVGPRRLHVLVAREFPQPAPTTTPASPRRLARRSSRRRTPTSAFTRRTSGERRSNLTLNLGVRYDLQFLETITTDTNNVSPRIGLRLDAVCLAEHHRARQRRVCSTTVCRCGRLRTRILSAGNTTDLANLRQIGVSLSPTQAGAPVFPNILGSVVPTVTLVNLTTMNPDMQNAYSTQASVEVERQLGERNTVSVGYQYVRGSDLIISINQNVPSCVASGTNNGCRPNSDYANNSQYSPVAESNYHGLHVSSHPAASRVGLLSRQLHAVEVDEQRRRELLQLAN